MKTRKAKRTPVFKGENLLYTAMLNEDELNEGQEEQLRQMTEVWAILNEYPRTTARVKLKELGYTSAQSLKLIDQAETFFGDLEAAKVKAERAKQRHRLEAIVLNESYSIEVRLKAERMLAEILGTIRKPEDEGKKPKKRKIVRRTTSMKQVKEEAIEESYE